MEKYFGKGGKITTISGKFTYRKEQLVMAKFINSALNFNGSSIIEAGTGVGKSLAYLIPTILHSVRQNKKIAISTETKTLQRQLITNDIPVALEMLKNENIDFSYSVCFGSGNYVCKKRFDNTLRLGLFSSFDLSYLEKIDILLKSNKTFNKFDLQIPERIWNHICRIPEQCAHQTCNHYSTCTFQREKRFWENSNILIMNHHLFFANIAVEKTYLPDFDILILDEAQSLDDICSEILGFTIDEDELAILLTDFFQLIAHNKLIQKLIGRAIINKTKNLINELKKQNEKFFHHLKLTLNDNPYFIVKEKLFASTQPFLETIIAFSLLLNEISSILEPEVAIIEIEYYKTKTISFLQKITNFIKLEDENFVYWIDKKSSNLHNTIEIHGQPIEISSIMRDKVLSYYESTIFVSATLSINNSFNFTCNRYGIKDYKSIIIESPYNYKEQAILYMPFTDIEPSHLEYTTFLSEQIASIATITNGNCLVLFTSYSMINSVYEKLLSMVSFPIHIQGNIPAPSVLNNYMSDTNSILLGVNSFWQGIDLKGDLVRSVIITRLPFNVPDTPLEIARKERYLSKSKNYFYEYYLPEAIIKFKQGFGRLIRSEQDFGIIGVLDSRIYKKNYGKNFLNSIPECTVVHTIDDLRKQYKNIRSNLKKFK